MAKAMMLKLLFGVIQINKDDCLRINKKISQVIYDMRLRAI